MAELVRAWGDDPSVSVVTLYLESFDRPRRLAEVAGSIDTPVVAMKAGRTPAGSRAAASHTASVAGEDEAVEALLQEAGIVRAESLDELCQLARQLDTQPLPAGRRVGVVTNSGGPGIVCADALIASGMEVPAFEEGLRRRLAGPLPDEASTGNPVDMVASAGADAYRSTVSTLARSGAVDALVAIYTEIEVADREAVGEAIAGALTVSDPPIPATAVFIGAARNPLGVGSGEHVVPVVARPEEAAGALAAAARLGERRARGRGSVPHLDRFDLDGVRSTIDERVRGTGPGWAGPIEARRILRAAGIAMPPHEMVSGGEEAVAAARRVGMPVALTVVSPDVVHKTESGGVRLDLGSPDAVAGAYEEIEDAIAEAGATFDGVLVQPMLEGTEILAGARHSDRFGPIVVFGTGGILVEVLGDVTTRLAPLTDLQARDMIREIDGFPLLTGHRGRPEADLDALEDLLLRVSALVVGDPRIAELEVNPAFAGPSGYRVGDVRMRLVEDGDRDAPGGREEGEG